MAIRGHLPASVFIACGCFMGPLMGVLLCRSLRNGYVDVGRGRPSRYHRERQPARYWLVNAGMVLCIVVAVLDVCIAAYTGKGG